MRLMSEGPTSEAVQPCISRMLLQYYQEGINEESARLLPTEELSGGLFSGHVTNCPI